jgi:hypothetical protein
MLMHFTHGRDTAAGVRIRLKAGCPKNGGSIPRQGPDRLGPTQSAIHWVVGPLCPTLTRILLMWRIG